MYVICLVEPHNTYYCCILVNVRRACVRAWWFKERELCLVCFYSCDLRDYSARLHAVKCVQNPCYRLYSLRPRPERLSVELELTSLLTIVSCRRVSFSSGEPALDKEGRYLNAAASRFHGTCASFHETASHSMYSEGVALMGHRTSSNIFYSYTEFPAYSKAMISWYVGLILGTDRAN